MGNPVDTNFTRRNNGNFSVVDDADIGGGLKVVATTADRDAIPSGLRKPGMLVAVQADLSMHQLQADGVTWQPYVGGGASADHTTTPKSLALAGTPGASAQTSPADHVHPHPAQYVSSVAALAALATPTVAFAFVRVTGFYADGDGGGGRFYWDPASTATAVPGFVVIPNGHVGAGRWIRHVKEWAFNVLWFGAKIDDTNTFDSQPAFQAAHDWCGTTTTTTDPNYIKGNRILVPPGNFYLNADWTINRHVFVEGTTGGHRYGASRLNFSDGHHLHVAGHPVGQPTPNGQGSQIRGLYINSLSTTTPNIDGIYCETTAHFERCAIIGFSGSGLNVDGSTADRNANGWSANYLWIENNMGWGVIVGGINSNTAVAQQIQMISNGIGGFRDSSFLGVTWIAPHVETPLNGPKTAQGFYCDCPYSTIVNPYVESDHNPAFLGSGAIVIGGDVGCGFTSDSQGIRLASPSTPIQIANRNITDAAAWLASHTYALNAHVSKTVDDGRYFEATAITTGISGSVEPTWPTTVGATVVDGGVTWTARGARKITFNAGGSTGSAGAFGFQASDDASDLAWLYGASVDGWWELTRGGTVLMAYAGGNVPTQGSLGPNVVKFPQGISISSAGQTARHVDIGAAPPTSGTSFQGDVRFNVDPATSGYIGWICTVGGTNPGGTTWVPFGPVTTSRMEYTSPDTLYHTIATVTPAADGLYELSMYYRIVTGNSDVTFRATYADQGGAQSLTLYQFLSGNPGGVPGSFSLSPKTIMAKAGTAITLDVNAGVAANVKFSGAIRRIN